MILSYIHPQAHRVYLNKLVFGDICLVFIRSSDSIDKYILLMAYILTIHTRGTFRVFLYYFLCFYLISYLFFDPLCFCFTLIVLLCRPSEHNKCALGQNLIIKFNIFSTCILGSLCFLICLYTLLV